MSIETLEVNEDDAALAIKNIVNAKSPDLTFESTAQYTREFDSLQSNIRKKVSDVVRLHGVNSIGAAAKGDKAKADLIQQELEKYETNPDAYIDNIDGEEDDDDENEPVAVKTPAAMPQMVEEVAQPQAAVQPAMALHHAPNQEVLTPPAEVKVVDRSSKNLFNGISSDYATEMTPTFKWAKGEKPEMDAADPDYMFDGFAVKIMNTCLRKRRNMASTGDPGCGKTEFYKQFGARVGLPVHVIPFDGSLTRAEIIGSFRQVPTANGPATPFVLGLIPRLIQQPCIIVIDEIDQADPDIQYMLHPVYEGKGLTINEDAGRFIPRHEHCYIVAAGNTKGRGSSNGLTNVKFEMSEATRDRFSYWVDFTYLPESKESETIQKKTSLDKASADKIVKIASQIRKGYQEGQVEQPCSLRQLLDVAGLVPEFTDRGIDQGIAIAVKTVIMGRANPDDIMTISEYVKLTVGVDLTTMSI